jgi:integrase
MARAYLLTPLKVKNERCPADKAEIRLDDGDGLFLRIRRDGTKTFVYRYGGHSRTLGRWPDVSLADARKQASALRPARRGVRNPIVEARARERKARDKGEAQRRRQAAAMTVGELFERFLALYGESHWTQKTIYKTRCLWRLHSAPLAALKACEVRREHLARACDKLLATGKRDSANRLHKLVRQIFAWGHERELLEDNVLAGAKKKPARTAPPKSRALSFDELRTLLHERIPAASISVYAKCALRLILATACRPGEILGVRWHWIDEPARLLRLPRTKNSLPHDVPLSDYALCVVDELATVRLSDWVIPQSISPETPLRTDTLGSLIRDRQVREQRISGRTQTEAALFMLPGGAWSAHDLRRTAASRLQELDTEPHLIEAILHHVPSNLIRTYQTYDDLPARRRALDLLGSALERLEQGKPFGADVIPLKRSRKGS